MNLAFGVVEDDESRAGTPIPYAATVSPPASSATMSNPYGALVTAARDPFVDPIRGVPIPSDSRLGQAGSDPSSNGGNVPSRPAVHASTSESSTSSPRRPPPAKQASYSPVRLEKGTYRSDTSQPQQQYAKSDDRNVQRGPVPVSASRPPAHGRDV